MSSSATISNVVQLHQRPGAGDVSRPGRRARPGRRDLRAAAASLYAGAARLAAVDGPGAAHRGAADHRRSAEPDRSALGLPLPHALPVRRDGVRRRPSRRSAAGAARQRMSPPATCTIPLPATAGAARRALTMDGCRPKRATARRGARSQRALRQPRGDRARGQRRQLHRAAAARCCASSASPAPAKA